MDPTEAERGLRTPEERPRAPASGSNAAPSLADGPERKPADCRALSETLARIGDKWTVLVVEVLEDGPIRFNEIRRTITTISQRMLTLTLRNLERDGLVTRRAYPSIPPRVEYELTELGRTLLIPLVAIAEWARTYRPAIEEARKAFDANSANASSPRTRRRIPALLAHPSVSRDG
jgi:DNA-binding HxlR family transcriptional regulator